MQLAVVRSDPSVKKFNSVPHYSYFIPNCVVVVLFCKLVFLVLEGGSVQLCMHIWFGSLFNACMSLLVAILQVCNRGWHDKFCDG